MPTSTSRRARAATWRPPTASSTICRSSSASAPKAIICSGHGLQPIWPVDRESSEIRSNPESQKLARRFGRLVTDIGNKRGVALDNVSDLARVLRVPGTMNVKHPDRPVPTWCEADTGTALTVEDFAQALDDYGLTELQSDAGVHRGGDQRPRRGLLGDCSAAPAVEGKSS